MDEFMTPPQFAEFIGVSAEKVLGWIRTGELRAINLSQSSRPRWKIVAKDAQAFLDGRANHSTATPAKKSRRTMPTPTKRYV